MQIIIVSESGKEYDSKGQAHPWWTNETMKEFHKRIQCFIDHYETYHEDESPEESEEEYDIPMLKRLNSTTKSHELVRT